MYRITRPLILLAFALLSCSTKADPPAFSVNRVQAQVLEAVDSKVIAFGPAQMRFPSAWTLGSEMNPWKVNAGSRTEMWISLLTASEPMISKGLLSSSWLTSARERFSTWMSEICTSDQPTAVEIISLKQNMTAHASGCGGVLNNEPRFLATYEIWTEGGLIQIHVSGVGLLTQGRRTFDSVIETIKWTNTTQ
jgi:hypothetical protein